MVKFRYWDTIFCLQVYWEYANKNTPSWFSIGGLLCPGALWDFVGLQNTGNDRVKQKQTTLCSKRASADKC